MAPLSQASCTAARRAAAPSNHGQTESVGSARRLADGVWRVSDDVYVLLAEKDLGFMPGQNPRIGT
jgi:hypothetical protein